MQHLVFLVFVGEMCDGTASCVELHEYGTDLLASSLPRETSLQVDASRREPTSFVFESEDARSNEEKLMVLIHGSGVVRAGQWARRCVCSIDAST
jgi:hypothetical protein